MTNELTPKQAGRPSDYNERMADIYALCCPDTGEIRYVGKANKADERLKRHLQDRTRRKTPLYSWINKLSARGVAPTLRILERVPFKDWQQSERRLIAEHRRSGRLLNLADGGDEPMCPPEVRSANGKKNAAKYWNKEARSANGRHNARAIHSDPARKKWWLLVHTLSVELSRCQRGVGHANERRHKKIILNCMAMADLYPAKVPEDWHAVRWDSEKLGDLNLDVIAAHMSPSLFCRFDFTGVYQ